MTKLYRVSGTDRARGAIGAMQRFTLTVAAATVEEAQEATRQALYRADREHVLCVTTEEVSERPSYFSERTHGQRVETEFDSRRFLNDLAGALGGTDLDHVFQGGAFNVDGLTLYIRQGYGAKADAWLKREGVRIVDVERDQNGEPFESYFSWNARLHCPELGCNGAMLLDYRAEELTINLDEDGADHG